QSNLAHLVAAGVFDQHGRTEEQRAALEQASRDVRALEQFRHLPIAVTARVTYFLETGDFASALAEFRSRRQSAVPMSGWEEQIFAALSYENGKFQQALEAFDRLIARGGNTTAWQVFRCYVLAELPDGPARALAAYRDLTPSGLYAIYASTVP